MVKKLGSDKIAAFRRRRKPYSPDYVPYEEVPEDEKAWRDGFDRARAKKIETAAKVEAEANTALLAERQQLSEVEIRILRDGVFPWDDDRRTTGDVVGVTKEVAELLIGRGHAERF